MDLQPTIHAFSDRLVYSRSRPPSVSFGAVHNDARAELFITFCDRPTDPTRRACRSEEGAGEGPNARYANLWTALMLPIVDHVALVIHNYRWRLGLAAG